ncbi:hypothetical protein ZWY2020_034428 [Hordeum vulgare]|nr:hypothetical protein ZWY2020_034428 [Hordeum vulgare]
MESTAYTARSLSTSDSDDPASEPHQIWEYCVLITFLSRQKKFQDTPCPWESSTGPAVPVPTLSWNQQLIFVRAWFTNLF